MLEIQPLFFGKRPCPGICRIRITAAEAAGCCFHPKAPSIYFCQWAAANVSATDENEAPRGDRANVKGILPVDTCIGQSPVINEPDKSLFRAKLLIYPLAQ